MGSLLLCCLRAAEKFRICGQDEPARMTGTASWAEPFMFQPEARTALEGDWTLLSHQAVFSIGRDRDLPRIKPSSSPGRSGHVLDLRFT